MLLARVLRQVLRARRPAPTAADLQMADELYRSGRYAETAAHCARVCAATTDSIRLRYLLGLALWELGQLAQAADALLKAHSMDVSDAAVLSALAQVMQAMGRDDDAMRFYESLLALEGVAEQQLVVHARLQAGTLLRKSGRGDAAIAHFRSVLAADPDSWQAHQNLFLCYYDEGDYDLARHHIGEALRVDPSNAMTRIRHAIWVPAINASAEAIRTTRAQWREKVEALLAGPPIGITDPVDEIGTNGFYLAYHGENDRDLQALTARLCLKAHPALDYASPRCATRGAARGTARERVRVGFFSRHLLSPHPVGRCFDRVVAGLARSARLDVSVVLFGDVSADRRALAPAGSALHVCAASLEAARRTIEGLDLDVLVYVDIGMEPLSNFLAYARLAPVQCAIGGHPVTTGIPGVDYFFSSKLHEGPGAQAHYTERLVEFDSLTVAIPRPDLPALLPERRALGLPEGRRLYVCPSRLQKIHPDFDAALAQILEGDQDAEIVFFEDHQYRSWRRLLEARFTRSMPGLADRVRFLSWARPEAFINILRRADVILDNFHFGLGSTAFTCFATGTPVVTLPSPYHRGRWSIACYLKMGITECVAENPDHYARIALRLGMDREFRDSVRAKILAANAAIYDEPGIAPEMEGFFVDAVARA